MGKPIRRPEILVGLFVFILYFFTLPHSLTEADSGEWTVLAKYGGVPHPSGYPLYAILIRSFYLLSSYFLPVITSISLISAICSSLAAAVLGNLLFALSYSKWSLLSVLIIFTTYPLWHMSNLAEPFALNILICSLILRLGVEVLIISKKYNHRHTLYLGVLFGLAASNHHSAAWMLPFALVIFYRHNPDFSFFGRFVHFSKGAVLGLTPYLYLLKAGTDLSPFDFYSLNSISDLIQIFFRIKYGTFRLAMFEQGSMWLAPYYFVLHLLPWFSWIFFLFLILGIFLLSKNKQLLKQQFFLSLWFLSFVFSSLVFQLLFRIGTDSFMPSIIERFMAMPMIFLILPLAEVFERIYNSKMLKNPLISRLTIAFLTSGIVAHIIIQYQKSDRYDASFYENHAISSLKLASNLGSSQITSSSDPQDLGILHARWVLNAGDAQTRYMFVGHWMSYKYRQNIVQHWKLPLSVLNLGVTGFIEEALKERKSIYVSDPPEKPFPAIFDHGFEYGTGYILLSPKEPMPTLDEIVSLNEKAYAEMIKIPSCNEQKKLKAWDRSILKTYSETLSSLRLRCEKVQRSDLVERVKTLEYIFTSCQLPEMNTLYSWVTGGH